MIGEQEAERRLWSNRDRRDGRRVIVDCDVDVETLLRIMRGLETLL